MHLAAAGGQRGREVLDQLLGAAEEPPVHVAGDQVVEQRGVDAPGARGPCGGTELARQHVVDGQPAGVLLGEGVDLGAQHRGGGGAVAEDQRGGRARLGLEGLGEDREHRGDSGAGGDAGVAALGLGFGVVAEAAGRPTGRPKPGGMAAVDGPR